MSQIPYFSTSSTATLSSSPAECTSLGVVEFEGFTVYHAVDIRYTNQDIDLKFFSEYKW